MQVNPFIAVPLVAWLVAQWLKFSISAFKGDINFRYLYASGGMPSVHSAVVTSLLVTTWLQQGSSSPLFGVVAVVAAIVIYDSLGVRRSTGEQAIVLNGLVDGLEEHKISFSNNVTRVREVLGHQPREVFWGIVVGALIGLLGSFSKISAQIDWLTTRPASTELFIYLGLLAIGLAVFTGTLLLFGKRLNKNQGSGTLLIWLGIIAVAVGLFVGLAQYEKVATFGVRWPTYAVFAGIILIGYSLVKAIRSLPAASKETTPDRKTRWLEKSKKKRKK